MPSDLCAYCDRVFPIEGTLLCADCYDIIKDIIATINRKYCSRCVRQPDPPSFEDYVTEHALLYPEIAVQMALAEDKKEQEEEKAARAREEQQPD